MILALALTSGILSHTEVNVVLVPDPESPLAHVRVVVYSGSAEDPTGKEGLAWATARALLDRAGPRKPLEEMTVSVGRDLTLFTAAVEQAALGPALDALAGALVEPLDPDLAIRQHTAGPGSVEPDTVEDTFDAILFMGHPYAHPPEGSPGSRAALTSRDLAGFHAAHYRKGNLAIGIAASVTGGILERARAAFDPLGDGEPPREPRQPTYPTVPRVHVIETPGAARATVRIGQPLSVTRGHPDHAAILLTARCLDADIGLAGVRLGSDRLGRRIGALRVAIDADPSAAASAVRDAVAGLVRASRAGPPEDCLAATRSRLEESMGNLTPHQRLDLRLGEFLYGDGGHPERFAAGLSETSPEKVRTALSEHLAPERLSIVAFVPDARGFIDDLLSIPVEDWRPLRPSDFETTSPERTLLRGGF